MILNNPIFINQTDADVRYVNTTGDAVNGALSVTGNVAIGTITPAAKLHIAGAPALLNTTMEDILYLQRPYNAGVSFGSRAVFKLGRYSDNGSQSFTRLDIVLRSGSDTSTNTNAPEINVMTLRADGNVGIGTTTASERLTVVGNANISGSLDLNNSNLINATPQIINLSANFNISGNYNSRMIMVNSTTEVTGTIISGNSLGFNATIMQVGSGQVFITGITNNIPVLSYGALYRTAGIGAAVSVLHTGSNGYVMYGNTV
jgi:hypothetical protein